MLKDLIMVFSEEKQYIIDLMLAKDLRTVYVDVGLISIVMTNIITNAKEAMENGGTIRITTASVSFDESSEQVRSGLIDYPGKYVCISVADNGTGIDKEILPKIFDPYFSTKRRGDKKGLGLGLSTSYSIIKKHLGALLVESEKGVGTTVSLYLPAGKKKPGE
jgi:signal transduction histidine kinase